MGKKTGTKPQKNTGSKAARTEETTKPQPNPGADSGDAKPPEQPSEKPPEQPKKAPAKKSADSATVRFPLRFGKKTHKPGETVRRSDIPKQFDELVKNGTLVV